MLERIQQAFQSQSDFRDVEVVRDAWLIHFTTLEAADRIAANGFQQGSPLHSTLGHTSGKNFTAPGINFAFLASDDYSILNLAGFDFGMCVEAAVIFQADAIRMLHATDGFYQAVLWGPDTPGPFTVLRPTERPKHLEPHGWTWASAALLPAPLFDLLDQLTEPHSP